MQKKDKPGSPRGLPHIRWDPFHPTWMTLDYVCLFVDSFIHSSSIYCMQSSVSVIWFYEALVFKRKDCYCNSWLSVFQLCLYSSSNMSSATFNISFKGKANPSYSSKSTTCWSGLNLQKAQAGEQWLRQGLQVRAHTDACIRPGVWGVGEQLPRGPTLEGEGLDSGWLTCAGLIFREAESHFNSDTCSFNDVRLDARARQDSLVVWEQIY